METKDSLGQLQLLVDQFNDADDLDARDDVLADILRHESPQVIDFLRLVVAHQGEDPSTKADAWCGLYRRTGAPDAKEKLLGFLRDLDNAYAFCVAADALGERREADAIPLLQSAIRKPLRAEAMLAAVTALERIDAKATQAQFIETLLSFIEPATLDFERIDAMLKSLAASEDKSLAAELKKVGAHFLALAKKFPDDQDDLEELGEQALEGAAQLLTEPGAGDE